MQLKNLWICAAVPPTRTRGFVSLYYELKDNVIFLLCTPKQTLRSTWTQRCRFSVRDFIQASYLRIFSTPFCLFLILSHYISNCCVLSGYRTIKIGWQNFYCFDIFLLLFYLFCGIIITLIICVKSAIQHCRKEESIYHTSTHSHDRME